MPVLTEKQWQDEVDQDRVAHARPWPDRSRIRRVPIHDEATPQQSRVSRERRMARSANDAREREGVTENE